MQTFYCTFVYLSINRIKDKFVHHFEEGDASKNEDKWKKNKKFQLNKIEERMKI